MPITHDILNSFVSEHGAISVLDTQGKSKRLDANSSDAYEVFAKAERIFFGGRWYSRWEFEQVLEDRLEYY